MSESTNFSSETTDGESITQVGQKLADLYCRIGYLRTINGEKLTLMSQTAEMLLAQIPNTDAALRLARASERIGVAEALRERIPDWLREQQQAALKELGEI